MSEELTYAQVAEHDTKDSLYMVVHEKVYSVGKFVDEHPGGEEVLMDVAGQDATEAFEDVGHSDEAREILQGFLVGTLKRSENDPKPNVASISKSASGTSSSGGIPSFVFAIIIAVAAAGGYYYMQQQKQPS